MKVKVRVRPPAPVVWLLLLVLGAFFIYQAKDPVVYALGLDASATVLGVEKTYFLCIGSSRWTDCYDVRYAFRPAGGALIETSTVIGTGKSASLRPAKGTTVPVRYLPFLPQMATLRDYAVDVYRLVALVVLGWMVIGIPLFRLLLGGRARERRLEREERSPYLD